MHVMYIICFIERQACIIQQCSLYQLCFIAQTSNWVISVSLSSGSRPCKCSNPCLQYTNAQHRKLGSGMKQHLFQCLKLYCYGCVTMPTRSSVLKASASSTFAVTDKSGSKSQCYYVIRGVNTNTSTQQWKQTERKSQYRTHKWQERWCHRALYKLSKCICIFTVGLWRWCHRWQNERGESERER